MFLQNLWVAFQTYGELLSICFDIIPIENFRTLLLRHLKVPPKSAKRSSKFLPSSQQHRQDALIMTFYLYVELQGWAEVGTHAPRFFTFKSLSVDGRYLKVSNNHISLR
ncbi:hypothetical protein B5807_04158 [Epicoccum nigrum]|uniref:Uncharacterized protein n=1 Tax=Epicoccum nigrum TaxID=105696 RepID=A0A1Y2M4Z8_EPING|nr:hypothetical protein B5807_04158 [Epicoccum nigrum]